MFKDKDKEFDKLKQELETVKKQAKEYLDGWKRAKADYLNLEKDIAREKIEWIKFANLELILNLLPILDSFEQSFKQIPEEIKNNGSTGSPQSEWVKGILKIQEQFENFLKAQGVEKIKTLGEKFNPEFHEAVEKRVLSSDLSAEDLSKAEALAKGERENEIIEEIQAGYTMHGQVIRAAKVIIK